MTMRDAPARTDYDGEGLAEHELAATPYQQVGQWLAHAVARQAERGDVPEPWAMSVATVDADGAPDVRTVLMRFLDPRGPGFVTHLDSAKGRQLRDHPAIAASLTWPAMFRAIRFRGQAAMVDPGEVRAYFASRPWASRVSAWASRQSAPVESRAAIEAVYERYAARFPDRGGPDDVPVPPRWGGVRVVPETVEFWAGRRNRLHDRLVLTRVGEGDLDTPGVWSVQRLQP